MTDKISRRSFLKGGAAASCTLAVAKVPDVSAASNDKQQLATLIDISKCVGCGDCVDACQETNGHKFPEPEKPFPKMIPAKVPVMDWSDKRDENERLTPYNWLFIQSATVEKDGEELELTIPRRCMHCVNPPCVKLCPFGAAQQEENGLSRIDSDICLGGSKCKAVCPWHIPERQTGVGIYLDVLPSLAGNGVMFKCDRCYDRLEKGQSPACIEACEEDVQIIGNRDEIIQKAHQLAEETDGYIYGETENGGTNTIYVSPVPFKDLNKAVEKGKGKPHFKPVKNTMDDAENFTKAMFLAPVAGIAAAVGKFYAFTKNNKEEK